MLRNILSGLQGMHDAITKMSLMLSVIALIILAASYVYEVFARYFFRAPTSWSNDLVGFMLCISTFLALPVITQAGRHVAVEVVLERVPDTIASGMKRLIDLIGFVTCFAAAWFSYGQNMRQFSTNMMTMGNHPIPKWWITSVITFGLFMAAIHFLRYLFQKDNMKTADLEKLGIHL